MKKENKKAWVKTCRDKNGNVKTLKIEPLKSVYSPARGTGLGINTICNNIK